MAAPARPAAARPAPGLALEACAAEAPPRQPVGEEYLALCAEITAGTAPDWVPLIPAGPRIEGRDGRVFEMDDANTVVSSFNGRIPFDCDHQTHMYSGGPAVGWIEKLEARDGAVWGYVEWNSRGKTALEDKQYRYVSPVLKCFRFYDEDDNYHCVVRGLASAALTNNPNLDMPALNSRQQVASISPAPQPEPEDRAMKGIAKLLGLSENASEADVIVALSALQTELNAAKASAPTLQTHVPRADFDRVTAELNAVKAERLAAETAQFEADLNAVLDDASKAGKMAPAARASYEALFRNSCKSLGNAEGLKAARDLFASAPAVIPTQSPAPASTEANALSADEETVIKRLNIPRETYIKARDEENRIRKANRAASV